MRHFNKKAVELLWQYYEMMAPKKMTETKERVLSHMVVRMSLENCLKENDVRTYNEIVKLTKDWIKRSPFIPLKSNYGQFNRENNTEIKTKN